MTTIKISQLPDATTPLTGAEVVPLDQGGITKKVTANSLGANNLVPITVFGAVGDGVTDNTVAINNAFASAKTNGSVVTVPPGTYAVSGKLIVENGCRGLLGQGGTIKFTSSSAMILLKGKQSGASSNVFNFTMQDLFVDANNQLISYANGSVAVLVAENPSHCAFINNIIGNVNFAQGKGGIFLRSYLAGAAFTIFNRVIGNVITGDNVATLANPDNGPCIAIDILNSELNYAPYADATAYWKATFTAATATYFAQWNVIADNVLNGGYYGISIPAAQYTTVTGNVIKSNVRGISAQHCAKYNTISGNTIVNNISTAIAFAYGSTDNVVANNDIQTAVSNGEAHLESYVGSKNNTFSNNQVRVTGGTTSRYFAYCAVQSDGCAFIDNVFNGNVDRASIGVESAWNNATTNPASYAYNNVAGINGFAGTGMSGVTISGNIISNGLPVPAIFTYQVSDGAGDYTLTNCTISNNVVTNTAPNYQLEMAEDNAGDSNGHILKNNSFFPTEDGPGYYSWARGRAHFVMVSGNTPINYPISSYVYPDAGATPNVAYNDYVSLAAYSTATTVTNFTGANDGQVITVRLSAAVTIDNNANIVLKGGTDITGVTSNDYVTLLKRDSTTWTELSRSF
jgi:parallel beta-helix repeat protein